ncbi:MAG: carotenoid oxygenase family protein, partial [Ilumatobacteraceae bacterium]
DDGYLMTYVYDAAADSSEFVIFDALTMAADPVATIPLPRVPFGFHGSWVPASVADSNEPLRRFTTEGET